MLVAKRTDALSAKPCSPSGEIPKQERLRTDALPAGLSSDDLLPQMARDDGWWESILAEEERFLPAGAQHIRPKDGYSSRSRREKSVAHIPSNEVSARTDALPAPARQSLEPGDFYATLASPERTDVLRTDVLPAPAQLSQADWNFAETIYKQDQIISLCVSGYNRGGLLVENDKLHGFVPYSHLVDMTCQMDMERDNFLADYVGKELRLKVIECVPEEGRVVFSERAARADAGRRTELFSSLHQSQIVTGEVTNITEFGAFIDLGGVEGLIHISELSWGRVVHPSHILQLGQKVQVQVIDILPERCRIALSLKRLQANPWEVAGTRYTTNDIIPATVTSVVSFGVFARLAEGLEGLVHVSEMNLDGAAVRDIYSEGQKINVRILHMDPQHQRLGLSLKLSGFKTNV